MLTAESAPLAIAQSKDWLSEQMSTLSSELAVAHLTATDIASFYSLNVEVKAAPLLSCEWMMTGETGSGVVRVDSLRLLVGCCTRQLDQV